MCFPQLEWTRISTCRKTCKQTRGLSHTQTHLPLSRHSAPWPSPSLALGWGRQPPHVSDASPQVKLEGKTHKWIIRRNVSVQDRRSQCPTQGCYIGWNFIVQIFFFFRVPVLTWSIPGSHGLHCLCHHHWIKQRIIPFIKPLVLMFDIGAVLPTTVYHIDLDISFKFCACTFKLSCSVLLYMGAG